MGCFREHRKRVWGGGLEAGSNSRMAMAALDQEKASQHAPYKAQDSHSATGKTKT